MSYYDPFYPSLEATRLEIQRSFLALEQKLRLQRQLDLELGYENPVRAYAPVVHPASRAIYEDELLYREGLAKSEYLRMNAYDRQLADRVKYSHQEQSNNLRHLSKIERLERERLQLSRQRTNSGVGVDRRLDFYRSGSKDKYLSASDQYQYDSDDERLLRKYEDGTRARELKQDFMGKGKFSTAGKNQRDRADDGDRSPFRNLPSGSGAKEFSNQKLSSLNKNFRQGDDRGNANERRQGHRPRQEDEDDYESKFGNGKEAQGQGYGRNLRNEPNFFSNQDKSANKVRKQGQAEGNTQNAQTFGNNVKNNSDQTFGLKQKQNTKLSSRGRSRSQKHLNSSNTKLSPYKSFLEPATDRSPHKPKPSSTKPQDRSRYIGSPSEIALQKIKNRLKCSANIYKDSQFHNVKHELSHLFNTYDCEYRLRRELKMKINNHPAVLRKHAMVVQ